MEQVLRHYVNRDMDNWRKLINTEVPYNEARTRSVRLVEQEMQLNHLKDPQLKERDKIYLLTSNLHLKKFFKKLNHKKIEFFFINK